MAVETLDHIDWPVTEMQESIQTDHCHNNTAPAFVESDLATNLWLLTLLVPHAPYSQVPLRPDINHRSVSPAKLVEKKGAATHTMLQNIGMENDCFTSRSIINVFYKLEPNKGQITTSPMVSMARHNYNVQKRGTVTLISSVEVRFQQFKPMFVTKADFNRLCCIFNITQVKKGKDSTSTNEEQFDYDSIFQPYASIRVTNFEEFKNFLTKLQMPSFILNTNESLCNEMERFVKWIQFLTPIRSNAVEGGHREYLASTELLGYDSQGNAPMQKRRKPLEIPAGSSLFKNVHIKTVQIRDPLQLFCEEKCQQLKHLSEQFQKDVNTCVEDTWTDLWKRFVRDDYEPTVPRMELQGLLASKAKPDTDAYLAFTMDLANQFLTYCWSKPPAMLLFSDFDKLAKWHDFLQSSPFQMLSCVWVGRPVSTTLNTPYSSPTSITHLLSYQA
jgi:hypothetical protein